MANYVNFTKATFNPYNPRALNEGQFSWMTHDTGKQIGSERQNTIDVWMYDNEGNSWYEKKYDGYGEFGGMDYYELLAKMNGYSEEDLEDKKVLKAMSYGKEMRDIGISLAFDKLPTKDKKRKVLFPALSSSPKYNWKRHDFTQEAESDPNQSWYDSEDPYGEYDDYYDESKKPELTWDSLKESLGLNEAANDRFLQSAARNLAKQMRGKSASRATLKNRLNSMPLANMLKPDELEKVIDYAMEEMGLDEGRSINKISKDHASTVVQMSDTAKEWKEADGDRKSELLDKLRVLNKKKSDLEKELDAAVAGKDRGLELSLQEAEELAYLEIEVNKILEEAVYEYQANTNTPYFRELVSRMEGIVDKAQYKKMIGAMDKLLDGWYAEGYDKGDILNFFNAILPEGPND